MSKIIISIDSESNTTITCPAPEFLDSLTGTEEEKIIHVADKDLPTGTKYEIIDTAELPTDADFASSWEYVSGPNEKTSQELSDEDKAKYGVL